jgi:hypothetical protein
MWRLAEGGRSFRQAPLFVTTVIALITPAVLSRVLLAAAAINPGRF